MKLHFTANHIVALVCVAGTCAALAQPEQWLRYCTGTSAKSYRWVELSTNVPPGVTLPELEPVRYFGRWTTPLDPDGGRWICLDRTRRSGPCDRLFVDSNGDGRLDDESPVTGRRSGSNTTHFDPAKLVFKSEDGPISYHLVMRFYTFGGERARLLVGSAGWYEGNVELAGKKRPVQLLDGNVNGVFNDISANPADADRVVVRGDDGVRRYLGRFLEVDGQLLQIEVARDGAFLKVKPAEHVAFGQVRVPDTISELDVVGENGQFVREPEQGKCTVPVGRYRINSWSIDRKDDAGVPWKLSGHGFGEFGSIDVTTAEQVTAEVGEPVLAALTARETRNGASFSLRLKGRLGESVDIARDGKRPRAPRLLLTSTKGSYDATYTFEYG